MKGVFMFKNRKIYLIGEKCFIEQVIFVCYDLLGNYEVVEESSKVNNWNSFFIICAYDSLQYEILLKNKGLCYRENYILADDLFIEMDKKYYAKHYPNKKVAFWGCGECAEGISSELFPDIYRFQLYR